MRGTAAFVSPGPAQSNIARWPVIYGSVGETEEGEMKRSWRFAAGSAAIAATAVVVALVGGRESAPLTSAPTAPLLSAPTGAASGGGSDFAATSDATFTAVEKLAPQAVTNVTPGYLSVRLRELPPVIGPILPRPEFVEPPGESYPSPPDRDFTDPVVQSTASPNVMPAATSFDGLQNQNNATLLNTSARPPDSEGDVGPNHYVEWINLVMRVYDKAGNPVTNAVAGNALFSGLPNTSLCNTQNNGDPLVVYDQLANRWVLSQFAFNGVNATTGAPQPPYEQCVAVSTTNDPTGTYCLYDFNVSNTAFNDYGKIGVWPDGYYFTFGMFAGGAAYSGPGAMVVERPQMIQAGCPAAKSAFYQITSSPLTNASVPEGLPSDVDGPNPPPPGRPNYFLFPAVTVSNNALELWKFQVVDWTPLVPVTSFTASSLITVPAYDPSINCTPTARHCVPQAGTTNKLDLVGNRLMYRLAYRNWGSNPPGSIPPNTESLVTNESVDANNPADHVGVRWYEIRDPNGTPTAYQAATYAPDADHRWMGSAAQDNDGNLAVAYTASGSIFPTPKYAGRLESDPVSQLSQGEATMFAPPGPAPVATGTAGDQRWGDYSHLGTDPIDDCTFWYISEYMTATNLSIDPPTVLRNWGTRFGHFVFPTCTRPTAVAVKSFMARWSGRRITVAWRTTSEGEVLGFNVYRSIKAGPFRKLNPRLIAAKHGGSARGATYSFVDRTVRRAETYTYRLQVVSPGGKRDWYGIGSAATG
jgi:hypothetical protein